MRLYQATNLLRLQANSFRMDYDFIQSQVHQYQQSEEYRLICKAYEYYEKDHDIVYTPRKQLGMNGELEPATNAIDKRLTDDQFSKCIDQKRNYLLGRPFTIESEDDAYEEQLNEFFDSSLRSLIQRTGTDALLAAEVYWHPYYDRRGDLRFKKLDRRQVLVFWEDEDKSIPHSFVRFYDTYFYDGQTDKTVQHLDWYTPQGLFRWENGVRMNDNALMYTQADDGPVDHWEGRLPLIVWKLNPVEKIPFRKVKGLQDALNELRSQITNIALEDSRTTILLVNNYGGEMELDSSRPSLREFISKTGLIVTETIDGQDGEVNAITLAFEPEQRIVVAEMLKKAIIDNMRAFDVKDLRDMSAPNQMNIKAVYSDMAEDALEMQTRFQEAFHDLLFFVHKHLGITPEKKAEIIFNTDMMMNESDIIQDIVNSRDILSDKSLVAQHPWVKEVEPELERIQKERDRTMAELFERQGVEDSFPVRNDEAE